MYYSLHHRKHLTNASSPNVKNRIIQIRSFPTCSLNIKNRSRQSSITQVVSKISIFQELIFKMNNRLIYKKLCWIIYLSLNVSIYLLIFYLRRKLKKLLLFRGVSFLETPPLPPYFSLRKQHFLLKLEFFRIKLKSKKILQVNTVAAVLT